MSGLLPIVLGVLAGLLVMAFGADPARAQAQDDWVVKQSSLCTAAIQEAERRYAVPSGLLLAIGRAESGRPVTAMNDIRPWPWTINADGQGLFLDSKAAAVAWVSQQTTRHKYIDVGCMQVNLRMHPKAFASLEQAFEPTSNADYAARYLTSLYNSTAGQDWNIAVGLYHSHTESLAAAYRDRVAMVGQGIISGTTLQRVPLYVRAIRAGTLRVPLSTGRSTPINVNRQPSIRKRRPSACEVARILGPYLNSPGTAARCAKTAQSTGP